MNQLNLTKRTHSNPCFWTALWNLEYYEKFLEGATLPEARSQKVYSLNAKANKILHTSVQKIHFDKGVGLEFIEFEELVRLMKKYLSSTTFEEINNALSQEKTPPGLYVDFENHWTLVEQRIGYPTLMKIVRRGYILEEERYEIFAFVFFQTIRNYMSSYIEYAARLGQKKFEFYAQLKASFEAVFKDTSEIFLKSQWHLYVTTEHTFPLPDHSILGNMNKTMVALSPRMLLEIDRTDPHKQGKLVLHSGVPSSKLSEYRNLAITHTFKEIIFSAYPTLETWQRHPYFTERVHNLAKLDGINVQISAESGSPVLLLKALKNIRSPRARRRKNPGQPYKGNNQKLIKLLENKAKSIPIISSSSET